MAFHGRTNDNARLRRYLGLEEAATAPAIFVYPAARRDRVAASPGPCRMAAARISPCSMASWPRSVGPIASIARRSSWSATPWAPASPTRSPAPARPWSGPRQRGRRHRLRPLPGGRVPALLLHNPDDELVPLAEGKRVRDALLGAPMPAVWPIAEIWKALLACAPAAAKRPCSGAFTGRIGRQAAATTRTSGRRARRG